MCCTALRAAWGPATRKRQAAHCSHPWKGNSVTTMSWASPDYIRYAVDVTGDGRADLVGFGPDGVYLAKGHGDGNFDAPVKVINELGSDFGWTPRSFPRLMADVNGDGKADVVGFGI